MNLIRYPAHQDASAARAVTIGNFDGVHRGHTAILDALVEATGLLMGSAAFWPAAWPAPLDLQWALEDLCGPYAAARAVSRDATTSSEPPVAWRISASRCRTISLSRRCI